MEVKATAVIFRACVRYRNQGSFMIIVALATMLLPIYSQAQQNDASSAFIEVKAPTA